MSSGSEKKISLLYEEHSTHFLSFSSRRGPLKSREHLSINEKIEKNQYYINSAMI